MCSMCPSNVFYVGHTDALGYLAAGFERFRKTSKRKSSGKRSEICLVCKALIELLCDTEHCKVAEAKGECLMIIRALRLFRPEAEFVEKKIVTLGQICLLR